MSRDALVLFDREAADWWMAQREPGASLRGAEVTSPQPFCASLKAWAVLEKAQATAGVQWLGGLGKAPWSEGECRLTDWKQQLDALAPIPPAAPQQEPIRELLSGDRATPALLSLALLPAWAEQLAGAASVRLPLGRRFRLPCFARLGDLPALALAAVLRQAGQNVILLPELPGAAGGGATPHGRQAAEAWSGSEQQRAAWLAIGKLRHPEWPLVQLEAVGLPVVLFEPEPAPPLPELFQDASRYRCHPQLPLEAGAPVPPPCPSGGSLAPAAAWLAVLRGWPTLLQAAELLGQERRRLDQQLAQRLDRSLPALALVPEENDLVVERFTALMRQRGRPCAVLHHTAEVQPAGFPLRWQRHLQPGDGRLVPLRGQLRPPADCDERRADAVLGLDPVRAHLIGALELEAPLPWPQQRAVGWIHYPLQQQSLVPLADPVAYWQAVANVQRALADDGVPLLLARKPPLEPAGLSDAIAQGLDPDGVSCLPLAALLSRCPLLIAPGHLGTAHLEAIARGRPVVLLSPERLRRPCLLLADPELPLPRLTPATFPHWWRQQDDGSMQRLAAIQAEWLRRQLLSTMSLGGWLMRQGVALEVRPQAFLGSNLMAQRPLLDRAEQVGRLARRLHALRTSPAGRLLRALRRGGRRC